MLQVRCRPDLGKKALRAERCREIRMENLDRDKPVMFLIAGQIYRRHPAAAQLAVDEIATGQGGLELIPEDGGHGGLR